VAPAAEEARLVASTADPSGAGRSETSGICCRFKTRVASAASPRLGLTTPERRVVRFRSLQSRILFFFLGLFAVVQLVIFLSVTGANLRSVIFRLRTIFI